MILTREQAYGFCFGAKKLVQGAHEQLFKALGLIHPSFFQGSDAENVTVPVALLPSQGENQDIMNEFWAGIQKKPFAGNCIRKDFVRYFPLSSLGGRTACEGQL